MAEPKLDTSVPHSARVWNYWLGGKDNFAADRAIGDQVREVYPEIVELDFTEPVALMMLGILGNVLDTGEARAIVARLVDAVPSGSYLVINDGTDTNEAGVQGARIRGDAGDPYALRSPEEIASFFDGLELLEPGVVSTPQWRPESPVQTQLGVHCGVARKP